MDGSRAVDRFRIPAGYDGDALDMKTHRFKAIYNTIPTRKTCQILDARQHRTVRIQPMPPDSTYR